MSRETAAMRTVGLPGDLAWWRDRRAAEDGADPAALRALLERLQAWKTRHDADRALQPNPFFKMVWDGVYAGDAADVSQAIAEVEQALARR